MQAFYIRFITCAGANAQHNNTVHYSGSALESSFSARGQPAAKLPITVPGKPAVTVPTTNLNIGMDLWNNTAPVGSVPIKARPNAPGVSQAIVPGPMVGREGVMPEHQWMQVVCTVMIFLCFKPFYFNFFQNIILLLLHF